MKGAKKFGQNPKEKQLFFGTSSLTSPHCWYGRTKLGMAALHCQSCTAHSMLIADIIILISIIITVSLNIISIISIISTLQGLAGGSLRASGAQLESRK